MWEMYFQWFEAGAFAGLPLDQIKQAFPPDGEVQVLKEDNDPDQLLNWRTSFGPQEAGRCYVNIWAHYNEKSGLVRSITADHIGPPAFDTLFDLMSQGHSIAYGDGSFPLIIRALTIEHLPTGMLEVLGEPREISSGKDILTAIEEW